MTQGCGPEFINRPNSGPNGAIDTYFDHAAWPAPEEMQEAAGIVGAAYREIERTQDSLSICMDLVRDLPNATTVLAGMISVGHEAIPRRWKSDPEDTKMVLSMVGHMEIGYMRAQQAAVRRGPAFPELAERAIEIEQFLGDLNGGDAPR